MSATVVFDNGQMDDTKLEVRRSGERGPSAKEIAACGPCRLVLVVIFIACLLAMLIGAVIIIATAEKCVKPVTKTQKQMIETGMMYTIDPRAFLDSNNDGNGDLNGVTSKLAYIKKLGFNTISLTGIVNPADHKTLQPNIGTLDDLAKLVKQAKELDLYVVVALNPVFTSLTHPLFVKSSSNSTAFGSLYVWSAPTNPTNWKNIQGSTGWYANSSMLYYGYYGQSMPSLNYESKEVQDYMKDVLRFWLRRDLTGLVLEGVSHLMTTVSLQNDTSTDAFTQDLASVHTLLADWSTLAKENSAVLLGDPATSASATPSYYGTASKPELSVIFSKGFVADIALAGASAFNTTMEKYRRAVKDYGTTGYTTATPSGMHLSQGVGDSSTASYSVLLAMLPGLFAMTYGDEIALSGGSNSTAAIMQWDSSLNAGFTSGTPYQPVNAEYATKNVDSRMNGSIAVLTAAGEVRSKEAALQGAGMEVLLSQNGVAAYLRHRDGDQCVVVINLTNTPNASINAKMGFVKSKSGVVLVDSDGMSQKDKKVDLSNLSLKANQAVVIKVD